MLNAKQKKKKKLFSPKKRVVILNYFYKGSNMYILKVSCINENIYCILIEVRYNKKCKNNQ